MPVNPVLPSPETPQTPDATAVSSSDPALAGGTVVRVGALADLHFGKTSAGAFGALFAQVSALADILVLGGDLTDFGTPDEARGLAKELTSGLRIPSVAVLGNHDFESAHERDVAAILTDAGVHVLDGDACEIKGVAFAGVKGFGGGFGAHALRSWGEPGIKAFVREALDEALKFESALGRLQAPHRVAILHYSPIQATVEGEPPALYPFLGSSRLEEPLVRYHVSAVVHGHAHSGCAEGVTSTGVPVYNVSLPLLRRLTPARPFRILEFASGALVAGPAAVASDG